MSGSKEGGLKTKEKNLARDPNYYQNIGARGGKNGSGPDYQKGGIKASGFAADPDLASRAGRLGGQASRRGKKLK